MYTSFYPPTPLGVLWRVRATLFSPTLPFPGAGRNSRFPPPGVDFPFSWSGFSSPLEWIFLTSGVDFPRPWSGFSPFPPSWSGFSLFSPLLEWIFPSSLFPEWIFPKMQQIRRPLQGSCGVVEQLLVSPSLPSPQGNRNSIFFPPRGGGGEGRGYKSGRPLPGTPWG